MKSVKEHEYTTYPRRFESYRWYKPLLVGSLFAVFAVIMNMIVLSLITKALFGTTVSGTGYDDMDFYSAAGAFYNATQAASVVPCLLLAAIIVKDRPVSSYFSSMGGWRWKVFLKTLLAAFIIAGIPTIVAFVLKGKSGDIRFTVGGFIILALLVPLQGIGEELVYRGYIMQTFSSWFLLPVLGVVVQTVLFSLVHPYNIIGRIEILVSAVIYALVCIIAKGIESASALHIVNNVTEIFMAGFAFGSITAEQTIPDVIRNLFFKIVFAAFIIFADKKLHWFDEVKKDDVTAFNMKRRA